MLISKLNSVIFPKGACLCRLPVLYQIKNGTNQQLPSFQCFHPFLKEKDILGKGFAGVLQGVLGLDGQFGGLVRDGDNLGLGFGNDPTEEGTQYKGAHAYAGKEGQANDDYEVHN
jgi:hypothetical protein